MVFIFRYFTAGESHGKGIVGIMEGFPSNVYINIEKINEILKERQNSYGRGGRMKIECDEIEFISGIRNSTTMGSPICFMIQNRDYENWKSFMDPIKCDVNSRKVLKPRPGHADLPGAIKYNFSDCRNVLERSSARETAVRVAIGAICSQFLENFEIESASHVIQIGEISNNNFYDFYEIKNGIKNSVRCLDEKISIDMMNLIDRVKEEGDSLGGVYEIRIRNVPVGLGSYVQYDRKLDGILAGALMSINSMKAVEFGDGIKTSSKTGRESHDEIIFENGKFKRKTNRAGGIEGGMSNGEEIIIKCYHKPIPTLYNPIKTVNILSKEEDFANVERSDCSVISAASIVGESVANTVICQEFLKKFSGDSLEEVIRNWKGSR